MAGNTTYKNSWQRENVDRINLTVPKGDREDIQAFAEDGGESTNAFINRAITDAMERGKSTSTPAREARARRLARKYGLILRKGKPRFVGADAGYMVVDGRTNGIYAGASGGFEFELTLEQAEEYLANVAQDDQEGVAGDN